MLRQTHAEPTDIKILLQQRTFVEAEARIGIYICIRHSKLILHVTFAHYLAKVMCFIRTKLNKDHLIYVGINQLHILIRIASGLVCFETVDNTV